MRELKLIGKWIIFNLGMTTGLFVAKFLKFSELSLFFGTLFTAFSWSLVFTFSIMVFEDWKEKNLKDGEDLITKLWSKIK